MKKEATFGKYRIVELIELYKALNADGIPDDTPKEKIEAMHRYIKETAPKGTVYERHHRRRNGKEK